LSSDVSGRRPLINTAWLTDLIASTVPGPRPIAVTRQPLNMLSTSGVVYAVAVDRGPETQSQQLVLKVARTVDERHRREASFYRDLAGRAGQLVPLCHVADVEGGFMLLEDCRPGRASYHLDVAPLHALDAMVRTLAQLHAAYWSPGTAVTDAWPDVRLGSAVGRPARESGWDGYLSPADQRRAETAWGRRTEREAELSAARTLCHGDFHALNVLVGDASRSTVTFDWQDAHVGNPATDLALFLAAYLHPRDRQAADWVAVYHDELRAAGVTDYPAAELRRDVRVGTALALAIVVRLIDLTGLDPAGALLRLKHVLTAVEEARADAD
jgi:aminoglycoside phosphotransferase